jgi:hypothetical protein
LADFVLRIPVKFTVGALLEPFSDSFSRRLVNKPSSGALSLDGWHDGSEHKARSLQGGENHMRARPVPVNVAIVLLTILSLANLLTPLMPGGAPASAIYILAALGVLGLVGAVGLWMLKRWALWLTIVVSVLNILAAAPGLAFAPTLTLKLLATIGVVGFAVVILLVVLPNSRRAYT